MRTQSHRGIFESSNGKSDRTKWLVFGQHSRKQKLMLRQPTQRSTLINNRFITMHRGKLPFLTETHEY